VENLNGKLLIQIEINKILIGKKVPVEGLMIIGPYKIGLEILLHSRINLIKDKIHSQYHRDREVPNIIKIRRTGTTKSLSRP